MNPLKNDDGIPLLQYIHRQSELSQLTNIIMEACLIVIKEEKTD